MNRILATLVLTCALSVSALAGEIPTCSTAPATATGDVPTIGSQSVAGDMPTTGALPESSETESSVLTTVLLTLVSLIGR